MRSLDCENMCCREKQRSSVAPFFRAGVLVISLAVSAGLPVSVEAETNTVSAPAGFVRLVIPPESEILVSPPFYAFDADINAIFSNQLTGATNESTSDVIRKWDTASQAYTNAYKADNTGEPSRDGYWFSDFTGWTTSDLSFYPGQGFWIRNAQSVTQTVFVSGTVVLDDTGTVTFVEGFNLFGYPFSSRIGLNDAFLAEDGAYGTSAFTNADRVTDEVSYENFWLLDDGTSTNWVDVHTNVSELELGIGRGYWYKRIPANSFEWRENRPYSDLFPEGTNAPMIMGMSVNSNQDEITLAIEATGDSGELLEIYYKDLAVTDAFTSVGWLIAETNIATGGEQQTEWTDSGSPGRGRVDNVYARYYLVGRGDVDDDEDLLPDSRESFVHGTDPGDSDTDNDALDDGAELAIYGTDPNVSDTDSDCISDGTEVYYGNDPAVSNVYSFLPFQEFFETNTVTAGDISNQNNWIAFPEDTAVVQTNTVYEGEQALEIDAPSNKVSTVRHLFAYSGERVVWGDMYIQAVEAPAPTGAVCGSAAMYFDHKGRLVVYDGTQSEWLTLTNHSPVSAGQWVQLSVRLDFDTQKWLVCLDRTAVAEDLGFASEINEFSSLTLKGREGFVDNLNLSTNIPAGISLDEDDLPDGWELEYFGDLDEVNSGDPDNDGLSNLEEYERGTDPTQGDSDADGINDGLEVYYGNDPAVSNVYSFLPFQEFFETNTVTMGDISNQNNWIAFPEDTAVVQTNTVYEGGQALEIDVGANVYSSTVRYLFGSAGENIVWGDMYVQAIGAPPPAGEIKGSAAMYFDNELRLTVYDGVENKWVTLTNHAPVSTGQWVRLSTKLDYGQQEWLVCLEGVIVGEGLGFASEVNEFTSLTLKGKEGFADNCMLSTNRPALLSLDWDHLPDEWEMEYFGDLDEVDDGDPDNDGLSNFDEYLNGTDPTERDTDGDGLWDSDELNVFLTDPLDNDTDDDTLNDYWEVRWGLDPLDGSTSTGADVDNDDLTNAQEENLGTNPFNGESDGDGMADAWENTYTNLNPAGGLLSSLVSWWRFDEGSGTVAYDESRMWNNDGTLMDGVSRSSSGYAGSAVLLDGSDDYVRVADDFSLDSTDDLTLTLWVKIQEFDSTNDPVYFVSKEDTSDRVEYSLSYVKSSQSLRFSHDNTNSQSETVSVTCNLEPGTWTHLAVAVSNANVSFYTNGALCGATQSLSYARSNLGDLIIGSTLISGAVDPTVHGLIDEVRVYNEALGEEQLNVLIEGEGDDDADGLKNVDEYENGSSLTSYDTDGDGLIDGYDGSISTNTYAQGVDFDGDGWVDGEMDYGTSPILSDTDGDGVNDGAEITAQSDPLVADQGSDTGGPTVTITYPKNGEYILW